jgi:thiamine pyrophosphokinase
MKSVVISHGLIEDLKFLENILRSSDLIICADGGAEYVIKCGLTPDALIGDLDSIDEELLKKIENTKCKVRKYPRNKDYTDTQLAIDYAIKMGTKELIMVGSVGDRIDHSLANIFLLTKLIKKNINACIINEKNTIYITEKLITLTGCLGDIVSLIPVGGDVKGIYTEGLEYKLTGQDITMGDPIGISNIFVNENVEIRVESGLLLVIKSRD